MISLSRSAQFFHGTTHDITDGMVRPANAAGSSVSRWSLSDPGGMSEGDHAFAARNNENYAWHAANTFHRNGERPRVYEVGSSPDMTPGPWNKAHPDFLAHQGLGPGREHLAEHLDEWASKTGFPVRNQIDIMPGRQGTFPTINWNQFKGVRPASGPDANHPDDHLIEHGMEPKYEPQWNRPISMSEPAPDLQGKLF